MGWGDSAARTRQTVTMRSAILASALLLSACATRAPERPEELPAAPLVVAPPIQGNLVGLTAAELVQRFGAPALQVREGAGLKLQFRGRACVLDAYLYRPVQGAGVERVTHVDTRLHSGADTPQSGCVASLQGA